jgi:uncharacterized protein Yka (UPF0111/DUF47 family)
VVETLEELERVQLDDALKAATDLKQGEEIGRKLDSLGRERGSNAMSAATAFLPAIRELMEDLEASVENLVADRGQGENEIQQLQSEIRKSLSQLSQDLAVLGGLNADSD